MISFFLYFLFLLLFLFLLQLIFLLNLLRYQLINLLLLLLFHFHFLLFLLLLHLHLLHLLQYYFHCFHLLVIFYSLNFFNFNSSYIFFLTLIKIFFFNSFGDGNFSKSLLYHNISPKVSIIYFAITFCCSSLQ